MAANNFGQISGPFQAGQEVLLKIQEQEEADIPSLVKIGISYIGNFDLDIYGNYISQQHIKINDIDYQIGKTRMLELEDCQITSIVFQNGADNKWYIDYEY